ncbi:helix-hairpin-helix domain-containing protein [Mucilaginibacter sp. RS28]|uniref:Helix-hairpin-helix domain-containing protein n=1 Tax=Mucilaginibacter straminoryzae TaxID=2932774 RepID=A0A9X2B9P2_9SPHI|nr:DNA polymerase/3'-5' exonuclease PolX [Mucilaginibacter straminoryzae]MCJ8209955.1 helix-hairpin-helix domain-containing protein [Mucilaginibacter straminoryzae]
MENKQISRTLKLLSQLMELHDENPFKVKSIANAAFQVNKLPFPLAGKSLEEMEKIQGIGKSTAVKIVELLTSGHITDLDDLLSQTPEGIVEMMGIKGIGPKKIAIIWKELNIENVGELYYACNENRLIEAKGFGLKTQEEIRKAIEFRMAGDGCFLYMQVEPEAEMLMDQIKGFLPEALKNFAGGYRRCDEIITELEIVIGTRDPETAIDVIKDSTLLADISLENCTLKGTAETGLKVAITCVPKAQYYLELFTRTGDEDHVKAVLSRIDLDIHDAESEEIIYQKAGLNWIHPEQRVGTTAFNAPANTALIVLGDLKGSLHNHSTWSDGVNTIEEMALYCRDELKLEYLGISDHSRSAVYAKGLTAERVLEQHQEIDRLNAQLKGFHIFKGIESDILNDGSLDYPEDILKTFDFIVASIHSNLKMDEQKATARLIKAIENPYTTILGHPTGRLLLSRKGYDIDHKKVIDACAANNVVIEINSNPHRLDLDWRWHAYALEKGVRLSINPDAHRNEGFHDMKYGVLVARKGGLTKEECLNALSLAEITEVFKAKRG